MQRVSLMLLTLFALYACSAVPVQQLSEIRSVVPVARTENPASAPVIIQEATVITAQPKITVTPLAAPESSATHIALLLPLQSANFGAAAAAVQQGFMAVANLDPQALPVRVYDQFDENNGVVSTYREALANGACAVVGPLTRNGVTTLAQMQDFPVPTLGLNIPDSSASRNLYFFGMAIEAEARQIARLAISQGMKQAIIITSNAPLAQRLQFTFEEQWTALGGKVVREIEYNGDNTVFADIEAMPAGMVFFTTDAEKSRIIRPYLPNGLPAYGTSQLFAGNKNTLLNFDLDGVRFVDMPWLMQPDQPVVMTYPRANPPLATDLERLYALGIDAYRLVKILINQQIQTALPLDGVTGRISLNGQTFEREALPALFVQGHAQSAGAPIVQADPMFPDQPVGASSVDAAQPAPPDGYGQPPVNP